MTDTRATDAYRHVQTAGALAGLKAAAVTAEAASIIAAVCASSPTVAGRWARMFGLAPDRFADWAQTGKQWETRPTNYLASLVAEGRATAARDYALALAGLAVDACTLDPDPSLESINAAADIARSQLAAVGAGDEPPPEDDKQPPALPELLAHLDALIGLKDVKARVNRQVALLRVNELRREKQLKTAEVTRHLVFVGNPGTGKTTIGRLVAGIYRAMGLLEKGQLVETDRRGLVAGYVGQTALKTADVIKSALGGVLFIDEAYALAGRDDFGREAIDTLVKSMEDHRNDLVVIVAGYPAEMAEFIATNPGLESRFATTIFFPDYTEDELVQIFQKMCRDADFSPTGGCITKLRERLRAEPRDKGFGNGRLVRNVFEAALEHQAWRLRGKDAPTVEDLRRLRAEDLPDA